MATEVKLPRLGQGMESGTIVRWLKSEGDAVTKGEPLYELDTDKVTQEVEADADGVLLKIVVADGEVDVGTTVGDHRRRGRGRLDARRGAERQRRRAATEPRTSGAPAKSDDERCRQAASQPQPAPRQPVHGAASQAARAREQTFRRRRPRARRRAREGEPARAADRARARRRARADRQATGPEGRVIAEDVEKARSRAGPAPRAAPRSGPDGRGRRAHVDAARRSRAG